MARGRKKKVVEEPTLDILPERVQLILQEVKQKEDQEFKDEITSLIKARKGEWDVTINDDIPFFDSNLSYELTGYKPIDDKHGLDFDPAWYTEAKDTFIRTGHYCTYGFGTKPYNDFWTQEYIRCRDGITVNGYTITGDNYFFLNYYQLMDLTSTDKAGGGRLYDFPRFFVKQYEYFHYVELCKRLRKNAIGLKARGVGFSEIGAAIAVNTYNCRRNSIIVIAAQLENYLTKTLSKCWKQLDFLNDYTDGGFFKLRQVEDTALSKKASVYKVINGQKVEAGWMSEITGINADKPNKIRGDRTDILIYEESGSWPQWKRAFEQGDALVGIQGAKFGIKMAWGTGGDKGPSLEGLAKAYEEPDTYDALPYRHKYTPTGEEVITAYFIPAYTIINRPGLIDKRGWTDPVKGRAYYEKERDKKAADPETLIIHCAEYCFTADEALALEGTNKFNKVLISEQIARIRVDKQSQKISVGSLEYKFNGPVQKGNIVGFKWIENSAHGKVHIFEHPIWTIDDKQPKMRDMYVAGIDSIDIGQRETSDATKDPSDFCIVIKKRIRGLTDPMYVAYYKDRPQDVRDAYKTALKLMEYYNCQCVIEASKVAMITWARENKCLNRFMRRPRATMPDVQNGQSKQYGAPATVAVIDLQTDLIADFINDYCHTIWFPEMLDELNRYTNENKRKFDIVAAMGMAELGDQELQGIIPKAVENADDAFQDFGYYRDENGIKRWGTIPKEKPNIPKYDLFPYHYDNDRTRSSNPRHNPQMLQNGIY